MRFSKTIELVHNELGKFWAAQLKGEILTIQFGANGAKGEQAVQSFKNPLEAQSELANLFLDKVVEGYEDKVLPASSATKKSARTKKRRRRSSVGS